jgi:hypothetical protein
MVFFSAYGVIHRAQFLVVRSRTRYTQGIFLSPFGFSFLHIITFFLSFKHRESFIKFGNCIQLATILELKYPISENTHLRERELYGQIRLSFPFTKLGVVRSSPRKRGTSQAPKNMVKYLHKV